MFKLKYRILLGYAVPLLLSVAMAVVVYISIKTVEREEANVDRGYQINVESLLLESAMKQMQSSARGYTLVKDEKTLLNFQAAVKTFRKL